MTRLHLPIMAATSGPQAAMPVTQRDIDWRDEFVSLWLNWPELKRKGMHPSFKLILAAQEHAQEMHYRDAKLKQQDWEMHIGLNGSTPNERVRAAGYELPEELYDKVDNDVENVGANWEGPLAMLLRFKRSEAHWVHLMGLNDWFLEQTRYGVGVSGDFFDILIAHPET